MYHYLNTSKMSLSKKGKMQKGDVHYLLYERKLKYKNVSCSVVSDSL